MQRSEEKQGRKRSGVDETVIEKFAEKAGRTAWKPFINTDLGDLLLFVFLLAGAAGGFALDEAARRPFAALLILGHPGKLAKLTAGGWDTHSGRSGSALPIVVQMHAAVLGRPAAETPTVEGIFTALAAEEKKTLGDILAAAVQKAVGKRTEERRNVVVVLIDLGGRILGEAGNLTPWI